jgi:hypothetical protein
MILIHPNCRGQRKSFNLVKFTSHTHKHTHSGLNESILPNKLVDGLDSVNIGSTSALFFLYKDNSEVTLFFDQMQNIFYTLCTPSNLELERKDD